MLKKRKTNFGPFARPASFGRPDFGLNRIRIDSYRYSFWLGSSISPLPLENSSWKITFDQRTEFTTRNSFQNYFFKICCSPSVRKRNCGSFRRTAHPSAHNTKILNQFLIQKSFFNKCLNRVCFVDFFFHQYAIRRRQTMVAQANTLASLAQPDQTGSFLILASC